MRVTDAMYSKKWLTNLQRTAERLQSDEVRVASSKSIINLSDNPIGISKIIGLKEQITKQEDYITAVDDSINWLKTSENVLGTVTNLVMKAREIGEVGANGTVVQGDGLNMAGQIDQIIAQVIDLANTQYNGKYIFSGEKTQTKPFAASGSFDYSGDENSLVREIHAGSTMAISSSGEEIFLESDVLDSLQELRNALASNNAEGVRESAIPRVNEAFNNILAQRVNYGQKINRLESTKDQHEMQNINFKNILGELEEGEITETINNLKKEESAYQAALMVGSRMMQTSLLDFLK